MVLERRDGVLHRDGADFLIEVATTGANGMHAAAAQAVDHAGDLLDAGAGGANDADVAGVDDVGEGHGHGGHHAGAAVRTHEEQALLVCLLLQAHLVLERHVVREGEHVEPQVECALELGRRILTGDGEERHVGVRQERHSLLPAYGLGGTARSLLLGGQIGQEGLGLGEYRVHDGIVVRLHHDHHVAGARGGGLGRQQAGGVIDVLIGIRAHHDLALDHVIQRIDLVGQEHQVDGVLIAVRLDHGLKHRISPFISSAFRAVGGGASPGDRTAAVVASIQPFGIFQYMY